MERDVNKYAYYHMLDKSRRYKSSWVLSVLPLLGRRDTGRTRGSSPGPGRARTAQAQIGPSLGLGLAHAKDMCHRCTCLHLIYPRVSAATRLRGICGQLLVPSPSNHLSHKLTIKFSVHFQSSSLRLAVCQSAISC